MRTPAAQRAGGQNRGAAPSGAAAAAKARARAPNSVETRRARQAPGRDALASPRSACRARTWNVEVAAAACVEGKEEAVEGAEPTAVALRVLGAQPGGLRVVGERERAHEVGRGCKPAVEQRHELGLASQPCGCAWRRVGPHRSLLPQPRSVK